MAKNNTTITLSSILLILSIWLVFIYSSNGFLPNFISIKSFGWVHTTILGVIAIILNIILLKKTPDINTTRASLIFMTIGMLSILFSAFNKYPPFNLTGEATQLISGIFLFIVAPIILKTTNIVFKEKKDLLGVSISLFIIVRLAWELVYPTHISHSSDFLAFTGLFTLIILSYTIHIDIKSIKSIKNIEGIKRPSQIIQIIAIIASLLCIFAFNNKTAKLLTLILLPSVYIFQYGISRKLPKNIAEYISTALPITTGIVMTILIYLSTSFSIVSSSGWAHTLWQRGEILESLINSITTKVFFIGNGWSNINAFISNQVWSSGISNTHLNETLPDLAPLTIGLGVNHLHNEIAQYLTAGGILFVVLYIIMWGYLSWCARKNKFTIAVLTTLCALYTMWFTFTGDIVLFLVMFGVVVSNKGTLAKDTVKPVIKYALVLYSTIGLIIYCSFTSIFYIPYVKSLETKISKEAYYGTWYTSDKTGFATEQGILRKTIINHLRALSNNKKIFQDQMTHLIDTIELLKKNSNSHNPTINLELSTIYTRLYTIKSSPPIEEIRQREFSNWASSIINVIESHPNRPDLIIRYLEWHTQRGFDEAVDQVTKRALMANPNNAVALYWRGLLFIKHGNPLGQKILEDAYKNNINRYQKTDPKYYAKYKHLLDPAYR